MNGKEEVYKHIYEVILNITICVQPLCLMCYWTSLCGQILCDLNWRQMSGKILRCYSRPNRRQLE